MVQTKKKQKKNADFQKTKLKVGKPLGPSANNTVIDMASKTLIIPGQSIAVDKSDTIKTRRNLTLRELLSHIKHHNAGVRRDALNGIIELLEVHPMLLYLHLGSIMEALIPMVTDEDETVRKSLLSTLEHALDMLEPNHIQSFISLVVVHLTSAMNHIYEDVRIGALPFLALWTDRFASHFIPHASELLGNFVGMLDSGGSGNSGGWSHSQHGAAASSAMAHGSGGGAPGSRLASTTVRTRVFRAVGQFLALLQVNAGAGIGGGGSSSASSSSSSAMAFTSTLWSPVAMPTAAAPLPFSLFASSSGSQAGVSGASTARLSFFASGSASASSPAGFAVHQSSEAVLALADALSPAVLAFWMEGAAGVFGKAAVLAGDALDLCASALQVLVHVLRFYGAGDPTSVIPAQWAGAFENNILRHIGARFPFGEGAQMDGKVRSQLACINMHYIELKMRISPAATVPLTSEYLKRAFAPIPAASAGGKSPSIVLAEQFEDMQPALKILLRHAPSATANQLVAWTVSLPATHATRQVATRFLCTQLLAGDTSNSSGGGHEVVIDLAPAVGRGFALALVRFAYEVGAGAPETTRACFTYLRHVLARGREGVASLANAAAIAAALSVYLWMRRSPKKNSAQPPSSTDQFGPWLALPVDVQQLVLDAMWYLPGMWPAGLVQALERVLLVPTLDKHIVLHAIRLLHTKATTKQFLAITAGVYLGSTESDAAAFTDTPTTVAQWHAHQLRNVAGRTGVPQSRSSLKGKRKARPLDTAAPSKTVDGDQAEDGNEGMEDEYVDPESAYLTDRSDLLDGLDAILRPLTEGDGDAMLSSATAWQLAAAVVGDDHDRRNVALPPLPVALAAMRWLLLFADPASNPAAAKRAGALLGGMERAVAAADNKNTHPLLPALRAEVARGRRALGDAWEKVLLPHTTQ